MKEIPLTQGKVAIVDDEDYLYLSQFKWRANVVRHKNIGEVWYTSRHVRNPRTGMDSSIQMRRDIMRPAPGYIVAFENKDPLDNRRSNLVVTTKSRHNRCLRTKSILPRGVKRANSKSGFTASLNVDKEQLNLGAFATPEEAHAAYRSAFAFFFTYSGHPTRQEQP
jgi:hypothetical protein